VEAGEGELNTDLGLSSPLPQPEGKSENAKNAEEFYISLMFPVVATLLLQMLPL
jgi:hypothetical protein